MGQKLWEGWLRLRELALALKPVRVAALLVLGGLVFLLTGQGADVARALAERRSGEPGISGPTAWFFAATLAWTLCAWYWARVMLRLRFPGVPPQDPALQRLRIWTPRILGFVAAACVALAFFRARGGYPDSDAARDNLTFYGWWSAAGAAAFLLAVSVRRRAALFLYGRGVKLELLNVPLPNAQVYGELGFRDLGRTRWILAAVIAAAALFFVVFAAAPVRTAPALGSAAIVLIAAASWIAAGSALDFAGMRLRVPVFSALLALAVVFGLWNDNHAVRTLDAGQAAQRQQARPVLKAWLEERLAQAGPKARIPLYLVNAEGGGIRAAYWTVTVLGHVQQAHPAFADHVFSISGVSGGSLGAAVFAALLAEQRKDPSLDVKRTGQRILGRDFLAPVVATLLYPDLVQRILPVAVPAFDRARTLELAWEEAWKDELPESPARLGEPLDKLWEGKQWMPVLLLNATWVETGKRIIASNLRIAAPRGEEDFVDVEDANAFFAPRALPLSAAAHMSARFTYVSPAGTLARDGKVHGRVVDGGYFENSAATATLELMQTIELLKDEDPKRWGRVDVHVIHISNEPFDPAHPSDSLADAPQNPRIAPNDWVNEALSPLWALLNARDARGAHSRESTEWILGTNFLHFGLCRTARNAPLGWVLSASTRLAMEDHLKEKCASSARFDNDANLRAIAARLPAAPLKP